MKIGDRFKKSLEEMRAEAREAQLARPDGVRMYCMIDTINHRVLARHRSYLALAALHYIQFANLDVTILGEGLNRSWTQFDANALLDILIDTSGRPLGPHCYPYNEVIKHVRDQIENASWLICPYEATALVRQACLLTPDETAPYRFDPNGKEPVKTKQWTFAPLKSRTPRSQSSYGVFFLNQDADVLMDDVTRDLPAPPAEPRESNTKDKTPRRTRAGRAPRVMRTAEEISAGRPAANSKTGAVWVIVDRVRAAHKKAPPKELRALVMDACKKAGVNMGTASVQFNRWRKANGV